MTSIEIIFTIIFAAVIHASFQLSVSLLTLLSGHAIGAKRRQRHLLGHIYGFIWGSITMTGLLVATIAYTASALWDTHVPSSIWALVCGTLAGVGVAVWAFYYRSGAGTTLWLPRPLADFLTKRTKATDSSAEAFSLGLTSVLAEILFVAGPTTVAALLMIHLPSSWQLITLAGYVIIANSSLMVVAMLIGGGHKLSAIQRWRETNKRFLQFAAGAGLLVMAAYLFSATTTTGAGGF